MKYIFFIVIFFSLLFFILKIWKYKINISIVKEEKIQYSAHALGNYHGYIMTNSKEALYNSYKAGFRYFEVDIQKTIDGYFVAYHLWNKADALLLNIPFDEKNPVPDLKTFLNYRYLTNVFLMRGGRVKSIDIR